MTKEINDAELIEQWQKKLSKELNSFSKELQKEIDKSIEKDSKYNLRQDLTDLNDAHIALNNSLNTLHRKVAGNQQIEKSELDDVKENIDKFTSQLQKIKESIKDNLFTTKLEKLWLAIEKICYVIANIITNRSNSIVIEGNVLPLNDPSNYSTPLKTLPDRPNNFSFFTTKIKECIKKLEPQSSSKQEENYENVMSSRKI